MKNKKMRNEGIGFLIYFIILLGLTIFLTIFIIKDPIMRVSFPWWSIAISLIVAVGGVIFSIFMILKKRGAILGVAGILAIKIFFHIINLRIGGRITSILIPIPLLIIALKLYSSLSPISEEDIHREIREEAINHQ